MRHHMVKPECSPAPYETHLLPGARKLFFYFGALVGGTKVPPFSFYSVSKELEGSRILLRDLDNVWYHLGLRDVSSNIYETSDWISEQFRRSNCDQAYFIGNSGGGYAAILFAALTGLGKAVAFAPRSYLSPLLKLRNLDQMHSRHYLRMYRKCVFVPKAWDLKKILGQRIHKPQIAIYYDGNHRIDSIHAKHLEGISNIELHRMETGGHDLVTHLNPDGRLLSILQNECC